MGAASPTNFYAGTLAFGQWMNNLDLSREVRVADAVPLRLATGAEFRVDQYQLKAGEPASYRPDGEHDRGRERRPPRLAPERRQHREAEEHQGDHDQRESHDRLPGRGIGLRCRAEDPATGTGRQSTVRSPTGARARSWRWWTCTASRSHT